MVTLGVDAHKASHTVVAVDELGAEVGQKTVAATPAGHLQVLHWAGELGAERSWALEDCRHLTRRLEVDLLAAGERVLRVPPKLMALARRGARTRGKSDPIDALAVARAALREPGLPVAHLDQQSREIRLLTDHREDLVAERTRIENRLLWHLHELEPGWVLPSRRLDDAGVLAEVRTRLAIHSGLVADLAHELVERIQALTARIRELEDQLAASVRPLAPALLALPGCGVLTAAKLLGETAGIQRFRSAAAFALVAGAAPIPVWSGNNVRHRLNRGGNRQLNVALHRIAITQIRTHQPAQEYLARRLANGNTKREAIRCLRRQLCNVVYRLMVADALSSRQLAPATQAA